MNTYDICDKHGHITTVAATELRIEDDAATFLSGGEIVGHFRDYAWWVKRADGGVVIHQGRVDPDGLAHILECNEKKRGGL